MENIQEDTLKTHLGFSFFSHDNGLRLASGIGNISHESQQCFDGIPNTMPVDALCDKIFRNQFLIKRCNIQSYFFPLFYPTQKLTDLNNSEIHGHQTNNITQV